MHSAILAKRKADAHQSLAESAEALAERYPKLAQKAANVRTLNVRYPEYRELILLENLGDLLAGVLEATEPQPAPKPRTRSKPRAKKKES